MNPAPEVTYIAFEGDRCIASGGLREVVGAAKAMLDRRRDASVLIFDGSTGAPIEVDFRGTITEVLARLPDIPGASAAVEDADLADSYAYLISLPLPPKADTIPALK